jgi:hypothetical protein
MQLEAHPHGQRDCDHLSREKVFCHSIQAYHDYSLSIKSILTSDHIKNQAFVGIRKTTSDFFWETWIIRQIQLTLDLSCIPQYSPSKHRSLKGVWDHWLRLQFWMWQYRKRNINCACVCVCVYAAIGGRIAKVHTSSLEIPGILFVILR